MILLPTPQRTRLPSQRGNQGMAPRKRKQIVPAFIAKRHILPAMTVCCSAFIDFVVVTQTCVILTPFHHLPARPCQRCIKRGIANNCTEGHRKKAKYLLDDEELGESLPSCTPGFLSTYLNSEQLKQSKAPSTNKTSTEPLPQTAHTCQHLSFYSL